MIRKLRINEDSLDDFQGDSVSDINYIHKDYVSALKYVARAAANNLGADGSKVILNWEPIDSEVDGMGKLTVGYPGTSGIGFYVQSSVYNYAVDGGIIGKYYDEETGEPRNLFEDEFQEDYRSSRVKKSRIEGCHGKKSRKRRKGLKKESAYTLDSCPDCGGHISDDGNGYVCDDCGETYPYEGDPGSNNDYNDDNAYCIYYVNELDSEFGYDPGPQVVEDNLERSYAYKRAEELNSTAQDFEQYFVEPEPKRYW